MKKPDPLTLSQAKMLHKYLKKFSDEKCRDNTLLQGVIHLILKYVQYEVDDLEDLKK